MTTGNDEQLLDYGMIGHVLEVEGLIRIEDWTAGNVNNYWMKMQVDLELG